MFAHIDCGTLSYYYEAIQVEISENGCYNFVSNSTIDTYSYINEDYFKPMISTDIFLSQIVRGHRNEQFELQTTLLINTKYILVVTTFNPNVTGMFSVIATGPSSVNFSRISEYFFHLFCTMTNTDSDDDNMNFNYPLFFFKFNRCITEHTSSIFIRTEYE